MYQRIEETHGRNVNAAMPVNNQSGDESGQSNSTVSTQMPGIVQRLDRAATKTGYTTRACSDQCWSRLFRQGISASQFVAKVARRRQKGPR